MSDRPRAGTGVRSEPHGYDSVRGLDARLGHGDGVEERGPDVPTRRLGSHRIARVISAWWPGGGSGHVTASPSINELPERGPGAGAVRDADFDHRVWLVRGGQDVGAIAAGDRRCDDRQPARRGSVHGGHPATQEVVALLHSWIANPVVAWTKHMSLFCARSSRDRRSAARSGRNRQRTTTARPATTARSDTTAEPTARADYRAGRSGSQARKTVTDWFAGPVDQSVNLTSTSSNRLWAPKATERFCVEIMLGRVSYANGARGSRRGGLGAVRAAAYHLLRPMMTLRTVILLACCLGCESRVSSAPSWTAAAGAAAARSTPATREPGRQAGRRRRARRQRRKRRQRRERRHRRERHTGSGGACAISCGAAACPVRDGQPRVLVTSPTDHQIMGLAVNADTLFWGTYPNQTQGEIRSMPLAGGPSTLLASNVIVSELYLDGATLYYVTNDRTGNASLLAIPATGGTSRMVATRIADRVDHLGCLQHLFRAGQPDHARRPFGIGRGAGRECRGDTLGLRRRRDERLLGLVFEWGRAVPTCAAGRRHHDATHFERAHHIPHHRR